MVAARDDVSHDLTTAAAALRPFLAYEMNFSVSKTGRTLRASRVNDRRRRRRRRCSWLLRGLERNYARNYEGRSSNEEENATLVDGRRREVIRARNVRTESRQPGRWIAATRREYVTRLTRVINRCELGDTRSCRFDNRELSNVLLRRWSMSSSARSMLNILIADHLKSSRLSISIERSSDVLFYDPFDILLRQWFILSSLGCVFFVLSQQRRL